MGRKYDRYNKISDKDLVNICITKTNKEICDDQEYWKYRYHTFFGKIVSNSRDWKKSYMEKLVEEDNLVDQRKDKILVLVVLSWTTKNRKNMAELLGHIIETEGLKIDLKSMWPYRINDYTPNYKAIERLSSYYKAVKFLMLEDVYASVDKTYINNVSVMIDGLSKLGDLIPNKYLISYLGSKVYTKDFKDMMVPTYIWPADKEEILNLPLGDYVIKKGYSGAAMDVIHVKQVTGSDLVSQINNKEFRIVQLYSPLFRRCDEYRMLVVNGKILDVFYGIIAPGIGSDKIQNKTFKLNTYKLLLSNHNLKINNKIYDFIGQVYDRLVLLTGIKNNQLRIDFTIECSGHPDGDYNNNILPDIFNPDWNGNIYLNEIDTIASGIWGYDESSEYDSSVTLELMDESDDPILPKSLTNEYRDLSDTISYCNVQIDDNGQEGEVVINEDYSFRLSGYLPRYTESCSSERKLVNALLKIINDH